MFEMTLCCIIEINNKHIFIQERQLSWRVEKINLISNKACPSKTWTQHKYNMAANMEKNLSDLLSQMVADKARSFLGTRLFPLAILISFLFFPFFFFFFFVVVVLCSLCIYLSVLVKHWIPPTCSGKVYHRMSTWLSSPPDEVPL